MEKKKKGEGYSTEDMNAYTLLLEIRVPPERQRFYPEPLTFKEPPTFFEERVLKDFFVRLRVPFRILFIQRTFFFSSEKGFFNDN